MSSASARFDWQALARSCGAGRDGAFNAGAMPITESAALITVDADMTSRALSGGALESTVGLLVGVLRGLGVKRGDRVAGVIGRRPEAFTLALAVWRLGAIYVPLFGGFRGHGLSARLKDSGARLVFADAVGVAAMREVAAEHGEARVVALDAGDDADWAFDDLVSRTAADPHVEQTDLGTPATLMYTSGTTGQPKGCVLCHRAVLTLWPYVRSCLHLGARARLFSTADPGWSFGLLTTGLAVLFQGRARVLYSGPARPADWWSVMRRTRSSHFVSAPTGYRLIAAAGADAIGELRPLRLRGATSAGEALNAEVVDWFREMVGVPIHNSYGLSELGMVLAQPRTRGAPAPVAGAMGSALPGFRVRLLTTDGDDAASGEVGRLAVEDNGFLLGSSYWGREDEWREHLQGGWWLTEDLAQMDASGQYHYVGRSDDIIVSAGYNIGPSELETILERHPAVAEAACIGIPDPRKGQIVVAYVVLNPGHCGSAPLAEELRAIVGGGLGWYAAPKSVQWTAELPRTETGKLRRAELRAAGGQLRP